MECNLERDGKVDHNQVWRAFYYENECSIVYREFSYLN